METKKMMMVSRRLYEAPWQELQRIISFFIGDENYILS